MSNTNQQPDLAPGTNAPQLTTSPQTPPKHTLLPLLQSTPSNQGGTGSDAQAKADSTRKPETRVIDVARGIERGDLRQHQQCTFKSMQTFLLRALAPDMSEQQLDLQFIHVMQVAKKICQGLTPMLNSLKKAVVDGPESAMYLPYVTLTNEILAKCRRTELRGLADSDLDILCVCNDPNVIFGTHAEKITYRKPDLAYIHFKGVRPSKEKAQAAEHSWKDARLLIENALRSDEKVALELDWSQALMVNEVKWVHHSKGETKALQLYTSPRNISLADPQQVDTKALDTPSLVTDKDAKISAGSKRKATNATSSESKRQKTNKHPAKERDGNRPPPIVQTGIYGSEMLSVKGLNRAHALGMLTQNAWTWMWYFDSAGAIQTQGFNIFAHTADFVFMLMLLRRFDLPQWGFPERANSEAKLSVVREGVPPPLSLPRTHQGPAAGTRSAKAPSAPTPKTTFDVLGKDMRGRTKRMQVDPTSVVYGTLPVLAGRRTTVYDAQDPDAPEAPYVAKWSYPQSIRMNEAKTVWIAREIVSGDRRALAALTDVAAFKDFEEVSTDNIRTHLRSLGDPAQSLIDPERHGKRILRCIFEKKLESLTYITGLWYVRGMNNCMRTHFILWKGDGKHRVEHTDISFGNFGVDPMTLEVKLRDFDLARVAGAGAPEEPQGTERTGTIPFMALDLLTSEYWDGKVERLYRHDLEGFVWVTAAFEWLYDENGVAVKSSPVQAWFTSDYDTCRKEKRDFLSKWAPIDHKDATKDVFDYAIALLLWLMDKQTTRDKRVLYARATGQPERGENQDAPAAYQEIQKIVEDVCSRADDLEVTHEVLDKFKNRKRAETHRTAADDRRPDRVEEEATRSTLQSSDQHTSTKLKYAGTLDARDQGGSADEGNDGQGAWGEGSPEVALVRLVLRLQGIKSND